MRNGTSAEPSHSRALTRAERVPQRRVDRRRGRRVVVRLDLDRVGEVAERLAQQRAWRRRRVWPGSVRMSTSSSTWSGITLVFVPPCTTVGANVVCVHACAWRASPSGSSASAPSKSSGSRSAAVISGVEVHALDELAPRLVDLRRRAGTRRCGARPRPRSRARCRCGTAATRGPGVPRTRIFDQYVPFSPTSTGRRGPAGVGIWNPPDSVST